MKINKNTPRLYNSSLDRKIQNFSLTKNTKTCYYLALRNNNYEESDILGLFSTKEQAQNICDTVQNSRFYGDSCSVFPLLINEILWKPE